MDGVKRKASACILTVILLIVVFSSCFIIKADGFYNYTYNSDKKISESPPAVEVTGTINNGFNSPQDLMVDTMGNVYVADTLNNRIVVMDSLGNIKNIVDSFVMNGETQVLASPKGVFVRENGDIYICDTENARIVHLNSQLEFIRNITLTDGESLPKDFIFAPTKVALDVSGRIFVVSEGFNNGLLEFTVDGEYIRYMGASSVSLTASQMFWRVFSTKEQREKTASNVSTEYNNVEIDEQGFLMVTSTAYTYWEYKSGKAQPLRKLNAKGSDVLSRIGNPSGDLEYPDAETDRASYKGASAFVDVCTLPFGNYGVLDQNRGRVFVYNSDGEMLYEFGGPGNIRGGMSTAVAIDYYDGVFYSLDAAKNQVNIYTLNSYGKLFNDVAKACNELDFATEEKLWNKIIKENANCELAMRGLGMAAYRKQDMKLAMEYFEEAKDRENYSKAYVFERRRWIENNAVWLILIGVAVVALVTFIFKQWKKLVSRKGNEHYFSKIQFSSYLIFHPIRGYWELKREKRGSISAAFTFIAVAIGVKILSSLTTGFLFNYTVAEEYNFFSDVLLVLAAVLLWTVIQWCVTVLMNGEGSYKDIFISTGYSLVPYIWISIFAIVFSRVLSLDEAEFYTVITMLALLVTAFLLFVSIMSTHDYSVKKTFLVVLIIIIVILLVIFIVLLVVTLTGEMVVFIKDLYNEITLRT